MSSLLSATAFNYTQVLRIAHCIKNLITPIISTVTMQDIEKNDEAKHISNTASA
jgi:hypothetical protein